MTQKEKRILCILCFTLILLAAGILTRYYFQMKQWKIDNSPDPSEVAVAMTGEELTAGYRAVTTQSQIAQTQSGTKTVLSRTFTHKVYSPEGAYLATVTASVIGTITDSEAVITDLTAQLSDEQREGLTLSEHISGNTGTVVLYLNQISACHFQYRLSMDGTLKFL